MTKRITVGERIAAGETAEVFRATDGSHDYAVKLLHVHLANDPIVRSRFLREAQMLAGISHPNVVRVLGTMEHGNRPGMIMELLEGGTILDLSPTPRHAAELLRALCAALALLHEHGVVHRDIRPSHVLISADGIPKLTDFGMASIRDLSGLTRSTVFASNLNYADPYTWGRSHAQPAGDLYSLGAVLYHALSGGPPPSALFGNRDETARSRELSAFRASVNHLVADVICGMLDQPARRPRSAREVIDWIDAGRASGLRDIGACIHCGAPMPREAALCVECGRLPLEIIADPGGQVLMLRKISEEREVLSPFLRKLQVLSADPIPEPKLLIGDIRLYSRAERNAGYRLPVRIAECIADESVEPLIAALQGDYLGKIGIVAREPGRVPRRAGILITRLRYGRVVPPAAASTLRSLAALHIGTTTARENSAGNGPTAGLRREIAQAIGVAARRVAERGGAVEPSEIEEIGRQMERAVDRLEQTERYLQSVNLQDAYANLERARLRREEPDVVVGGRGAAGEEDAQRVFVDYADSQRAAASRRARITEACRCLERLTSDNLGAALSEITRVLAADSSEATT